ncbi:hypothetical protein BDK51DRAFT_47749 [Blyttiomyces helicus]|uniref:Uncharacterized protein n=1 Tax=Blyttiomyces helicus TaxID=388810 RepID=A0A4P9WFV8_9FUNG|nr:hypothetical protein BDK51DRAFT_47749 [Blyttiomyces helicus]|eukprot:RKO90218.1 hypothetical protein BDK51DRAFT_47749 [Blyttiomyces helicus]
MPPGGSRVAGFPSVLMGHEPRLPASFLRCLDAYPRCFRRGSKTTGRWGMPAGYPRDGRPHSPPHLPGSCSAAAAAAALLSSLASQALFWLSVHPLTASLEGLDLTPPFFRSLRFPPPQEAALGPCDFEPALLPVSLRPGAHCTPWAARTRREHLRLVIGLVLPSHDPPAETKDGTTPHRTSPSPTLLPRPPTATENAASRDEGVERKADPIVLLDRERQGQIPSTVRAMVGAGHSTALLPVIAGLDESKNLHGLPQFDLRLERPAVELEVIHHTFLPLRDFETGVASPVGARGEVGVAVPQLEWHFATDSAKDFKRPPPSHFYHSRVEKPSWHSHGGKPGTGKQDGDEPLPFLLGSSGLAGPGASELIRSCPGQL